MFRNIVLTTAVIVATVASVFAIWPIVSDAPWEEETGVVEQDTARDDLRCEAALTLRASLKVELARTEKPVGLLYTIEERRRRENLTDELEEAEADIRRYC